MKRLIKIFVFTLGVVLGMVVVPFVIEQIVQAVNEPYPLFSKIESPSPSPVKVEKYTDCVAEDTPLGWQTRFE